MTTEHAEHEFDVKCVKCGHDYGDHRAFGGTCLTIDGLNLCGCRKFEPRREKEETKIQINTDIADHFCGEI